MNRSTMGSQRIDPGGADPTAFVRSVCNYPGQKTKLHAFFTNYSVAAPTSTDTSGGMGKGKRGRPSKPPPTIKKYLVAIEQLGKNTSILEVAADDLIDYFNGATAKDADRAIDVLNTLLTNAPRALQLMYEVVEEIRNELYPPAAKTENLKSYITRRIPTMPNLPVVVRVDFELRLIPPTGTPPIPIHNLRAKHIGCLVKVEGTILKTTNVKPQLVVVAYRCESCGSYQFEHIEDTGFTPQKNCQSTSCLTAGRKDSLTISLRDSKFIRRQEARIQEMPHLVPPGTVPRSLKLVLHESLTRLAKPGTAVTLGGIFMTQAQSGYRRGQTSSAGQTLMEVHHMRFHRSTDDYLHEQSAKDDLERTISQMDASELYHRMAASMAPAIHGHDDIKKVLLLQLIGGSTESFGEGLKIRGDIHVLLMGDPGLAKSQLLLRVCRVAPRAHFTCGKGSSGVGLTASVVKDPLTGEFTLEGGAVVMSDNGVCCVDEFDKMKETDRTAIHEVMEQQTVSISKAGLNATLNARTTILAAANPVMGRYDISKSAVSNIGLPAALLSRFDIVFLLLDEGGVYNKDLAMARRMLMIHKDQRVTMVDAADGEQHAPLKPEVMRAIIAKAQTYNPKITSDLLDDIVEKYLELRGAERGSRGGNEENSYTTPRTLFGLLRLSQALARLRFSDTIRKEDFQEALRLMVSSKESVIGKAALERDKQWGLDTNLTSIMKLIGDMDIKRSGRIIDFNDVVVAVEAHGYSGGELEEAIDTMCGLGLAKWESAERASFRLTRSLDTITEEDAMVE